MMMMFTDARGGSHKHLDLSLARGGRGRGSRCKLCSRSRQTAFLSSSGAAAARDGTQSAGTSEDFEGESQKLEAPTKGQSVPVVLRTRRRSGRRLVFLAASVAAGCLLVVLARGGFDASSALARATTETGAAATSAGSTSGGSFLRHPAFKCLFFFGVVKAIHRQREFLKAKAAELTRRGVKKIRSKRVEAICIPLVAAFVGWLTNWIAVQMLFYPVEFVGLNFKRFVVGSIYGCDVLQPMGLLGWQGVVPAKAAKMGFVMVNMVTTKLIDVKETFGLLDPGKVATLLSIEVPEMARNVGRAFFPDWAVSLGEGAMLPKMTLDVRRALLDFQHEYLAGFVRYMQEHINRVLDVDQFITQYYVAHKSLLNQCFQLCGEKELQFLVRSGIFFGFLLGLPQILVWAVVDNIWSLVVGGIVVGYATNWIALKLIFEPVVPVKLWGGLEIQGIFLKRQQEVSTAFAAFYRENLIKSKLIWEHLLSSEAEGGVRGKLAALLKDYNTEVITDTAAAMSIRADLVPEAVESAAAAGADAVLAELPKHVHVLHPYIDGTLGVQKALEEGLKSLSPQEFEGVLHPVFQEEEFILILAGAFLGAIAGALQHVASEVIRAKAKKKNDAAAAAAKSQGDSKS
eukprot:CAMPEP_0197500068 /NCGR_PEP_ID=MMETSP1311-20131121/61341_1 /TAXON_ID=464262 /ORGANISM="Genus nov. species nov., Strain RCC856" /LENGTH=628 /DNA_ID=CAMNT_0043045819 /DNA_START=35 /DNA_END=1921 /DNA_ORIENTATION=-